jgi:hypothetical protein
VAGDLSCLEASARNVIPAQQGSSSAYFINTPDALNFSVVSSWKRYPKKMRTAIHCVHLLFSHAKARIMVKRYA